MNSVRRKARIHGSFARTLTEEQAKELRDNFSTDYPNVISRLDEIRTRMVWSKSFIDSLSNQIKEKGYLSEKQLSSITSMYIDSCAWTDEKVKEQQSARKLLYRLAECRIGYSADFIISLLSNSLKYPLSHSQLSSLFKVVNRFRVQLEKVPELTDDCWDGWIVNNNWTTKLHDEKLEKLDVDK
jgi:hypothetical protein